MTMNIIFEQKLNDVLTYLEDAGLIYYVIPANINTPKKDLHKLRKLVDLNESEIIELLEVLEEDKMIRVEWIFRNPKKGMPEKISLENCMIKYKGKLFINRGGYVGRIKKEKQDYGFQKRTTFWLVFATCCLAVEPIYKIINHMYHCIYK